MEKHIGVNIGTKTIKSVLIEKDQKRWVITKVRLVDHEYYGKDSLNPGNLKARLTGALDGLDADKYPVIYSIDSRDIYSATFALPAMPKDELDDAVLWEMKNHIPFASDDFILNYRVVENAGGKAKQLKIHASAAKREFIENIMGILKEMGLDARMIIPVDSAIEQLLALVPNAEGLKPLIILDLGDQLADIFIYKSGKLEFSRRLPFGMRDFVKSLMTPLVSQQGKVQLTREEAMKILHQHGIPDIKVAEIYDGKISNSQVLSLIRPKIENLVQEFQRSIDYYREHFGQDIEKFILLGGGAELKGLVDHLGSELGLRASVGLIAEGGPITFDGQALNCREIHRINIAIGAALCQGKGNNLIPRKSVNEKKTSPGSRKLAAVMGVICLALVAGSFYVNDLRRRAMNDYLAIDANIKTLKNSFSSMYVQKDLIQLVMGQQDWGEVLKDISNHANEKMIFTQIKMKDGQIHFKGIIEDAQEGSEKLLSAYLMKLEEGMLTNARLVSIKKDDKADNKAVFEIIAALKQ